MHDTDTRVEDRLRAALRAEADDLPFTITVDRLERRALERRRTTQARRSVGSLAAAAAVIVAVGIAGYVLVNRDAEPAATPIASAPIVAPPGSAEASTRPAVASFEQLLARVTDMGPEVGRGERDAGTADDVDMAPTGVRSVITIVAVCRGEGNLKLQVMDATKPYAQFRQDCDGTPFVHTTNGARISSAEGLAMVASAPANVTLRFVVVGVPAGVLPDPDTLIEADGISEIPLTTETSETVSADSDTTSRSTYRLPVGTNEGYGLWIGLVCQGALGEATWHVVDQADTTLLGPVTVDCDAVPSYDRAEAGTIPGSAEPFTPMTLVLDVPRDAGWAFSAVRLLPPGHPDPTVPCHAVDPRQSRPPKVEFFQDGTKLPDPEVLGSWKGQGGDSSADAAPGTAIPLASGEGLSMRIAGDVCAIRWRITYGPVPPDLVGHVAAGELAPEQDNPLMDPAYAVEDRFVLADLPSGEWWIQALLVWPDGSAYVNLRVTVP